MARRLNLETLEISGEASDDREGVDYDRAIRPAAAVGLVDRVDSSSIGRRSGGLRQVRRARPRGQLSTIGELGLERRPLARQPASGHSAPERRAEMVDLDPRPRTRRGLAARARSPRWDQSGRPTDDRSRTGCPRQPCLASWCGPRREARRRSGVRRVVPDRADRLVAGRKVGPDRSRLSGRAVEPPARSRRRLRACDRPFAKSPADEHSGRFSPDGGFVAYVSDESGQEQVYVEPLPQTGTRWLASPRAGNSPRWRANGLELLYVEAADRAGPVTLVSVAVTRRGAALSSAPRERSERFRRSTTSRSRADRSSCSAPRLPPAFRARRS